MGRNGGVRDEMDGVGSGYFCGWETLGKASDFFGGCGEPFVSVVTFDEMAIFESVAGDWVDDGVCIVRRRG